MHFSYFLRGGLLAALSAMFLSGCGETDPNSPRFVVAEGKGVKVTRGEVDKIKSRFFEEHGLKLEQVPPSRLAQMERQIAEQLAFKALLLQEAQSVEFKDLDSKVDAEIAKTKSKFPNEDAFQTKLIQLNLTLDELRGELAKQYKMEETLRVKVPPAPDIPLAEVEKFYKEHKMEFSQPATIRASHVLVKFPEQADAAAKARVKKKAEEARARVLKGEDFGKVAREISDDTGSAANNGELPPFTREGRLLTGGGLVPPFVKAANSTKANAVSPVFETEYGYHFLKVLESKPAGAIAFDQAKDLIVREFANRARQKAVNEYIAGLIKTANVTYHLPAPEPPKMDNAPLMLPQGDGSPKQSR